MLHLTVPRFRVLIDKKYFFISCFKASRIAPVARLPELRSDAAGVSEASRAVCVQAKLKVQQGAADEKSCCW